MDETSRGCRCSSHRRARLALALLGLAPLFAACAGSSPRQPPPGPPELTRCERALDSLEVAGVSPQDGGDRALAISGGGSKGAFAVGAVCYLVTRGITFDIVAGTSTGALIAPLVVTRQLRPLVRGYTSVSSDSILKGRSLWTLLLKGSTNSLYSTEPLSRQIERWLPDSVIEKVMESPTKLIITTTSLQTGDVTYWKTGGRGQWFTFDAAEFDPVDRDTLVELETPDEVRRAIHASSNQPVFMPPIEVFEHPPFELQYVDGGVRENAPLQIAVQNGATELYGVWLGPNRHAVNKDTFIASAAAEQRAAADVALEAAEGASAARLEIAAAEQPLERALRTGLFDIEPSAGAWASGAVPDPPESCEDPSKRKPSGRALKRLALRTVTMFVREVAQNDVEVVRLHEKETRYRERVKERLVTEGGLEPALVEHFFASTWEAPTAFPGDPIELHVIQPEHELPTDGLHFDQPCMRWMMDYGFVRARQEVEGS